MKVVDGGKIEVSDDVNFESDDVNFGDDKEEIEKADVVLKVKFVDTWMQKKVEDAWKFEVSDVDVKFTNQVENAGVEVTVIIEGVMENWRESVVEIESFDDEWRALHGDIWNQKNDADVGEIEISDVGKKYPNDFENQYGQGIENADVGWKIKFGDTWMQKKQEDGKNMEI